VIYFEFYKDVYTLNEKIADNSEKIQCIISNAQEIPDAIPFGTSQNPELWDFADGIDTMEFLINL
jgi:hypothetical protein